MPIKGFIYPNGDTISLVGLKSVDIKLMGITLPTLLALAVQRDDKDRLPSTTELISGTCESYLKRTNDYYIDPQDKAFALAGTMHHLKMEEHAQGEDYLCEVQLKMHGITGVPDLYSKNEEILYDYKNAGSYKVAKALGMSYVMTDSPTGEVYKTSRAGKWAKGSPKQVRQFYVDPEKADPEDWTLQLNFYRILINNIERKVKKIFVQATVRDGGIMASRDRGISRNIYMIPIPIMRDTAVLEYFFDKRDKFNYAMENNELPEKCNDTETWDGKKCESYCDVRSLCPYMKGNKNDTK